MRKIIIAAAFVLVSGSAFAGTYQEAMKTCGTEWRASEQRKSVKKGEGAAAWNAFRAECTKRVGWEKKGRGATTAGKQ
jgi:hypothetical protein